MPDVIRRACIAAGLMLAVLWPIAALAQPAAGEQPVDQVMLSGDVTVARGTVVGEVVKFDPAEIAKKVKDYTLDLPADLVAKYTGKPAVIATSVITAELADIGKKLPPPMTPAEEAFDKVMKSVSAANTALQKGVSESSLELTKQQTTILKKNFMEAQLFFKNRGTADATGWAQDAYKFVDAIETAAVAGKWEDVQTSTKSLAGMCSTCHAQHRERMDDGTFRIKGSS